MKKLSIGWKELCHISPKSWKLCAPNISRSLKNQFNNKKIISTNKIDKKYIDKLFCKKKDS